jgi:hypothetical protein
MKKTSFAIVCLLLACLGAPTLNAQNGQGPQAKPLTLPAQKPFPASQTELLHMRDTTDVAGMRAHAWDLFAGLTSEDPIWNTWYTKCDIGLMRCNAPIQKPESDRTRLLKSLEFPMQSLDQLSLPAGAPIRSIQNAALAQLAAKTLAHPQLGSVLFNQEAADRILEDCLYPRNSGFVSPKSTPCPPLPRAPGHIDDFTPRSVVLKTVWELLVVGAGKTIGPLQIWNSSLWDAPQKANTLNPVVVKNLQSTINVNIKLTDPASCKNQDYGLQQTVPISCFYYLQPTQQELEAIGKTHGLARVIGANPVPANYLVLVGVHVATKEIPEWVWATFWWDIHSVSDRYAEGRPASINSKWAHFLMNTTLDATTPHESDRGPKICFNPFLETSIPPNGVISNCLQCHRQAAYGPAPKVPPYVLGILARDGKGLASGAQPDPTYFDSRVQTDFLWSIANSQTPQLQNLVQQFNGMLSNLMQQKSSPGANKP